METKATRTEIYNLIILDESGSMDCVRAQTISGCNETINTIKAAQKKYKENQKHYVSIYAFQSEGEKPSRYIIKNTEAEEVSHITEKDYQPDGCTPLNDAVGSTLSDLKMTTKKKENAIGSVTIITDGMENSSKQYDTADIARMIDQLKELGWSFNFIGANIDVVKTASQYNIENTLEFNQDAEGTAIMFAQERESRMCYYDRLEEANILEEPMTTRAERFKKAAKSYFKKGECASPSESEDVESTTR